MKMKDIFVYYIHRFPDVEKLSPPILQLSEVKKYC